MKKISSASTKILDAYEIPLAEISNKFNIPYISNVEVRWDISNKGDHKLIIETESYQ